MPAIKTKYNFCQYRSRLEAYWAVFFDLLGWEYESPSKHEILALWKTAKNKVIWNK